MEIDLGMKVILISTFAIIALLITVWLVVKAFFNKKD